MQTFFLMYSFLKCRTAFRILETNLHCGVSWQSFQLLPTVVGNIFSGDFQLPSTEEWCRVVWKYTDLMSCFCPRCIYCSANRAINCNPTFNGYSYLFFPDYWFTLLSLPSSFFLDIVHSIFSIPPFYFSWSHIPIFHRILSSDIIPTLGLHQV